MCELKVGNKKGFFITEKKNNRYERIRVALPLHLSFSTLLWILSLSLCILCFFAPLVLFLGKEPNPLPSLSLSLSLSHTLSFSLLQCLYKARDSILFVSSKLSLKHR